MTYSWNQHRWAIEDLVNGKLFTGNGGFPGWRTRAEARKYKPYGPDQYRCENRCQV